MAESSSSSNDQDDRKHVVVDLGRKDALLRALIALSHSPSKSKVKSALIVRRPNGNHSVLTAQGVERYNLMRAFQVLGNLPNLAAITIDASSWRFPVSALVCLLKTAKALKHLKLKDLALRGNLCDQNNLGESLAMHTSLQSLVIENCQGTACVRTLLTKASTLRTIKIRSTRLSQSDLWASTCLVEMCQNNASLQSLTLSNVPDLDDQHLAAFADFLSSSNPNHDNATCAKELQELHITSSCAGETAAEAIAKLLLAGTSISRVTINLRGIWSSCGNSMAKVLSSNTTLVQLSLAIASNELDGWDAAHHAIQIAQALSSNNKATALESLQLYMDMASLEADGGDQAILDAFESVLDKNYTLGELHLLNQDGSHCHPLNPSLCLKLDLNRSGLTRLLVQPAPARCPPHIPQHQQHTNDAYWMDMYICAMASSSENLSLLFYGLSNNPALFRQTNTASTATKKNPVRAMSSTSSPVAALSPTAASKTTIPAKTKRRRRRNNARRTSLPKKLSRGAAVAVTYWHRQEIF